MSDDENIYENQWLADKIIFSLKMLEKLVLLLNRGLSGTTVCIYIILFIELNSKGKRII